LHFATTDADAGPVVMAVDYQLSDSQRETLTAPAVALVRPLTLAINGEQELAIKVNSGQSVSLSAEANGEVTLAWAQTSGPAVTLDPAAAKQNFTAPAVDKEQTISLTLTATDILGQVQTAQATVTVSPQSS